VSRAVALLERRKLIVRKSNREDMRESFLSLTPAGQVIYDDLVPRALDFARQLADAVDPADLPVLERALRRLGERAADLAKRDYRR
jgi:DNA-binding MarR family transcriptional regulator